MTPYTKNGLSQNKQNATNQQLPVVYNFLLKTQTGYHQEDPPDTISE
jgi:hypothetical protein